MNLPRASFAALSRFGTGPGLRRLAGLLPCWLAGGWWLCAQAQQGDYGGGQEPPAAAAGEVENAEQPPGDQPASEQPPSEQPPVDSDLPAQQVPSDVPEPESDESAAAQEEDLVVTTDPLEPDLATANDLPTEPANDALSELAEDRYASLWADSAFGIAEPVAPQTVTEAVDPMDGVRLVGLMEQGEQSVVLIQRGEGNPVERLTFESGSGGLDLIEVERGQKLDQTRVMLAGPNGEGWIRFQENSLALPQNDPAVVAANAQPTPQQQQEQQQPQDDRRGGRDRGRGRWSDEERQEASTRVTTELQRTQTLLSQAQDPTERANLEERISRLQEFQRRIQDRGEDEGGGGGGGGGRRWRGGDR